MKKIIPILSLITVLLIAGCTQTGQTTIEKQTIKIGASLPLTGDLAFLGEAAKNGILLAKEQLNDRKYNYEIIFEDDRFRPEVVSQAATKLISVDKVSAITSFGSTSGNIVSPIAWQNKIVHIGTASDSNIAKGDFNFIHATPPRTEAEAWSNEAANRGVKKVAAITGIHQGWTSIWNATKAELRQSNITVVSDQSFNLGDRDFRTLILKARASNPDIYFVGAFSPEIELIIKQMKELGITSNISSIEAFELSSQPELFEGLWYVNAASPTNEFRNEYVSRFNGTPQVYTPEHYDIIIMLADAFDAAGDGKTIPSSDSVAAELMKIRDFDSAVGRVSMGPDHVIASPAVVRTIKDGKPVTIE